MEYTHDKHYKAQAGKSLETAVPYQCCVWYISSNIKPGSMSVQDHGWSVLWQCEILQLFTIYRLQTDHSLCYSSWTVPV